MDTKEFVKGLLEDKESFEKRISEENQRRKVQQMQVYKESIAIVKEHEAELNNYRHKFIAIDDSRGSDYRYSVEIKGPRKCKLYFGSKGFALDEKEGDIFKKRKVEEGIIEMPDFQEWNSESFTTFFRELMRFSLIPD